MRGNHTRRRFLQTTGVGTVGFAGCTHFSPEQTSTRPSPPSTLIATWRGHDPTSTVTIQWIAPTDELDDLSDSATVGLSAESGESDVIERLTVTPFGNVTHLHRFRAVMTNLESDTRYGISIDGSDTGLFVRTAPESLTDPLVFAEGGDVDVRPVVPSLHRQAASWDPLFGFLGGDLAYAEAHESHKWIRLLEQWSEHMRSDDRLIPLVAAIGNHEVPDSMDNTPDEAPFFYSLFDNPHREHAYWAFDVGDDVSLLILDSNHTTQVEGAQTEWLEDALAERVDRKHLMAAYHVPAYPVVRPENERDRDEIRRHWVPLLEAYDVDVAFEHDDHAYKRTHLLRNGEPDPDGVLYLGDGAWGRDPREVYTPDERPYLSVSESTVHVIRVELRSSGAQRFHAIDSEGTVIDGCERSDTEVLEHLRRP